VDRLLKLLLMVSQVMETCPANESRLLAGMPRRWPTLGRRDFCDSRLPAIPLADVGPRSCAF